MKTNQWLTYLLDEQRADFVGVLRGEAAARGWLVPDAAIEAWATALRDDLEAEAERPDPQRTLDELVVLAGIAGVSQADLVPFWAQAEQLLYRYITNEPDMVGGAKRLASLRVSTFGQAVRQYLTSSE